MPGSDQKGPLASASDGVNWDVPNQSFDVRFPGNPRTYTWKLGRTVTETGAHKFGSSQDDDSKSKPIATLTYNILFLVDLPNGQKQLAVFTRREQVVKPVQHFISTVKAMGVDAHYQMDIASLFRRTGSTNDPYFSFDLQFVGEVESEVEARMTRGLYDFTSNRGSSRIPARSTMRLNHSRGAASDFVRKETRPETLTIFRSWFLGSDVYLQQVRRERSFLSLPPPRLH